MEILGLKKPSQLQIAIERDERMRPEYLHITDVFSLRIHQLSEAIDRVCFSFVQSMLIICCFLIDLFQSRTDNLVIMDLNCKCCK
jgi:hypothetical protein